MAPKKRSHAESSSSQLSFDHSRFLSLKKVVQFHEQYQSRNVELEREVAEELHDKHVCSSLSNRNWYSWMKFESSKIYVDWVREFYNNLEIEESGSLKTYVLGKWIMITTGDIADFIDIPMVENQDYPIPKNSQFPIDYDLVGTTICGVDTRWPGGILPHGNLTTEYQFLNRFVCHNPEPMGHTSEVNHKNGYLLYCIGTGKQVNIPQVIMNVLIRTMTAKKNSILPYGVLITEFLLWKEVPKKSNEVIQKIQNPINACTLAQSTAHIPPAPQGDEGPEDEAVATPDRDPSPRRVKVVLSN